MRDLGIVPPPASTRLTEVSPSRGTCAIASVRGDVTTARAAAAVRVRQGEAGRGRPAETPDGFPIHWLRAGPA